MSSNKRTKTSAQEKKAAGLAGTIADVGVTLLPKESVYLKCDTLNGMLRVVNITPNETVVLPAAASVQKTLGREEITGDDLPNHLPVGMGQADQVRFEVVRINSDLVPGGNRELDPDNFEKISDGQKQWTMEELMDMIEPLPGSESKKKTYSHYLGYRRSIWRALKHQSMRKNVTADIVLDVLQGKSLPSPYNCKRDEMGILVPEALGKVSVAFIVPRESKDGTTTNMEQEPKTEKGKSLDTFLKSIGTPGCVSLLQKIIRRRPKALTHPDTDETMSAIRVIKAVSRRLLDPQQPGIFLPDQGVYVSARQHFVKRLLVMMAEDSEYSNENACLLASSALLLGCEPSWQPPSSLCERWAKIAVELWKSPMTSDYDAEKGFREKPSSPLPFDQAKFPSLVLEELGGMQHDKGMFRWLRNHPKNTLKAEEVEPTAIDSLDIYCDQHVSGNIVYLWRPRTKRGPARIPYGPELDIAFRLVSGKNPRRRPAILNTKTERKHEKAILVAMKYCSRIVRGISTPFPTTDNPVEYGWDMPDGALAGMIGPTEVRAGGKTLVVTVDPTDLRRWVVIPKPSRSSDLKDITDEERKDGLKDASEIFASGVKLRSAPHPSLDGLTAKFNSESREWEVDGVAWETKKKVKFSLVQYPDWESEYDSLPFDCPKEYEPEVIQWVAGRIGGYEPMVHMPTIARDGSGTKEALTGMESYSLMLKLSLKYPDALWPAGQFSFETRCIPLRLEIREKLLSSLKKTSTDPYPAWTDDRKLRPLQQEALEGMLRADAARMGSFLWMLVGSGKSMTVLSFIHKTRRTSATLWCLPMSAMKSVASEIRRAGWKVCVLASSAGRLKQHEDYTSSGERTLNTNLRAGTITLLEHDDVRNLVAPLSPQMLSSTFVYDEVHKAMAAKTQRTGSALRLAQLAKQMVALTGTPIVDSRAFTLINWLRFCVPFQVHSRNFWVAANSMIAKLASTPVQVDRHTVSVPLTTKESNAIDALLPPRLGGTARKPDYKGAYDLSVKCVDTWIVNRTMEIVYGKRGKAPEGCPEGEGHAYAVAATRLLPPSEELFNHLPQRVLLVAADRNHGAELVNALIARGAPRKELMFIGGRTRPDTLPSGVQHAATVCFTAEEWRRGEWVPNICVAPISYCEGYSLTWMTTMITGVYPSNQSKRTQMEGRINRANCERLHRTYITAMAGLTEVMYKYQRNAKNLESALANLSKMKD